MSSKTYSAILILAVFGLSALFMSAPAFADIINYGADGTPGGGDDTLLFRPDFRQQPAANVSHIAYPDDTNNLLRPETATTGTWGIVKSDVPTYGESPLRGLGVTDCASAGAGGDPGPYSGGGANYLRFKLNSNPSYKGVAEQFTTQTSGTVHWEDIISIPTHTGMAFQVFGDGAMAWYLSTDETGYGTVGYYNGSSWIAIAGLTYTPDVWQKWQIDWTIGDPTAAISIDAVSRTFPTQTLGAWSELSAVGLQYAGYTNVANFYLASQVIPEPGTLALLATGLIGLLCYAWRKRR